jgi:hypothetical protein
MGPGRVRNAMTASLFLGPPRTASELRIRSSEAVYYWWQVMDSNQRRTTPTVLQTGLHPVDLQRCPLRWTSAVYWSR